MKDKTQPLHYEDTGTPLERRRQIAVRGVGGGRGERERIGAKGRGWLGCGWGGSEALMYRDDGRGDKTLGVSAMLVPRVRVSSRAD